VADPLPIQAQRNSSGGLAEADQPAVGTRARRESLCREVNGLEQVGLAGSVLACDEDDAWRQGQIEGRVGAEVAERDAEDDQAQPASRIGMIRYV
jgi:hypothetical protein